MKSLRERAEEILDANKTVDDAKKAKQDKEYADKIKFLKKEFTEGFAEFLPLLKKEGIKWEADLHHRRYVHRGTFIKFFKDTVQHSGYSVKMDFNNRNSYRYESVPPEGHAKSVFDKWNKEGFILFLFRGFGSDI